MSQEVIKGTSAKKEQILSYGCVKKLDSPSREEQARLAGKEAQYFSTHRFKLEVGRDLLAGNSS